MTAAIQFITSALAALAEFFLLPMGLGRLIFHRDEHDRGLLFISGLFAALAFFELVYLPFFFLDLPFSLLTAVFHIVTVPAAVLGFILHGKKRDLQSAPRPPFTGTEKAAELVMLLFIGYQIARVTFGAGTWNVDDGWYLSAANSAMSSDRILRYDILTGYPYDYSLNLAENMEYVFSPWPFFWAMSAKVTQLQITVLMRTVLPGAFIAVFYYVVYRLMKLVFDGDRERTLVSMAMLAVLFEIIGIAMNVKYTWVLCYPWMGKGFGPSVICPAVLLLFLLAEEEQDADRSRKLWLCVFLGNLAGCAAASSCAELNLITLGCWGLANHIRGRRLSSLWKPALAAVPSLALMLAHLVI